MNNLLFLLILSGLSLKAQPILWENSGISGGSALLHPSFSPFNSDVIYLASDLTGMFFTENGGKTWDLVPFYELKATTQSKIYFTSHPDTLFTIHNDFRQVEQHIYRSDDGGETWRSIPSDPTGGRVVYLYVDEDHTNRLIAADESSIYFSGDCGQSFQKVYTVEEGLYIGGAFWDDENIFLGTNAGLLGSTDGGKKFERMPVENLEENMGILGLTGVRSSTGIQLFCSVRHKNEMWTGMLPDNTDFYGEQQLICIEKKEAGLVGKNISGNLKVHQDFPYFVNLTKENERPVLYSAGAYVNETAGYFHPQVYKLNESSEWEITLKTDQNANIATGYMGHRGDFEWPWSENAMGFGFDPNQPEVAILTDYSFAHITHDAGRSWEALYVLPEDLNPPGHPTPKGKAYRTNGLENTSCWWLNWASPSDMFASYTDITAIRSTDSGGSWCFNYQGLDGNLGYNYTNIYQVSSHPETGWYAAASTLHDIYQSTDLMDAQLDDAEEGGAIFHSEDGGKNWSLVHDFDRPVIWTSIDPDRPNIMYASVINSQNGGTYKTENLQDGQASTWTQLSVPPQTEGHPFNIRVISKDTLVCTYSGRLTADVRFTPSSGVFYSEDGGTSWEDRSLPEMKYWTKDLVLDPHDASGSTWYVGVFDGYDEHPATLGTGGLYRTTDRGKTWRELGDFYRVESVGIHPGNPDIMYVTTEQNGLWYTDDLNSQAPQFILLKEYPFQHPMRVFFNPFKTNEVWVTSFGNGLRKGLVEEVTKTDNEPVSELALSIFPNPAAGHFQIKIEDQTPPYEIRLFNSLGQQVYGTKMNGASLSVQTQGWSPGIYILDVRTGRKKGLEKIIVLR